MRACRYIAGCSCKNVACANTFADGGLTEVVKPDGQQYTLKHGRVLIEAISAGIKPPEVRREVEKKIRYDIVTHDPDASLIMIAKQQRNQAVVEANDAVRQQTAKRNARSVAVAGIKPQGSTWARLSPQTGTLALK